MDADDLVQETALLVLLKLPCWKMSRRGALRAIAAMTARGAVLDIVRSWRLHRRRRDAFDAARLFRLPERMDAA